MQFDSAKKPSATPPAPTPPQRATLLFNQALAALKANKLAESEKLYRQMLQVDPTAAVGWANLGLLLSRQKRYDEAIADLKKAVSLVPKELDFQAQLATTQWSAGKLDDALATTREILAKNPNHVEALHTQAAVLFSQGHIEEALVPLTKWTNLRPKDPNALGILITTQLRAGKQEEALVSARLMCERFPKEANAHLMRGDLAGRLGSKKKDKSLIQEARDAYSKAYAIHPQNTRAGINAALAMEQSEDISGAIVLLEKLRQKAPDNAFLRHRLGLLYLRDIRRTGEQRVALGLKEVEAAVAREPKNPEYVTSLGFMILAQGASKDNALRAASIFRVALKLAPTNPRTRMGLVEALSVAQDWPGAVPLLQELVKESPNDDALRRRYAEALNASGKRSAAALELRTIAQRSPKEYKTLLDLAQMLELDGNAVEAEKTLQEALTRSPGNIDILVRLGNLLTTHKKFDEAKARFEAALAQQPENALANAGYVALFEVQNRKDDALKVRERWVKIDPKNNQARYELGMAYAEAGRDAEALAQLKQLTLRQGDPNRTLHRQAIAEFYHRRSRFAEEAAELRGLLVEEPNNEALKVRMASVFEQANQLDEAERMWDTLIRESPGNALRYRLSRVGLYERGGKLDRAFQELEDLVSLRTDSAEARTVLLRLRTAQKHPEAAYELFEKVALSEPIQPNPNLVSALNDLYQDKQEKFLAFTQRAVTTYPKSPIAWRLRAQTLLRPPLTPEHRAEAAASLKKVTELDQSDPSAPLEWGKQLEALGKRAEAIAAYTLSVQRRRSPEALAALTRLGAPIPPEKGKKK